MQTPCRRSSKAGRKVLDLCLTVVIFEPGYGSGKQGKERVFITTDELPKITGDAQFRLIDGDTNIVGNLNDDPAQSGAFSLKPFAGGKWAHTMQLGPRATANTDVLHLEFGNNVPHNNLPPSIACYGWRRTA